MFPSPAAARLALLYAGPESRRLAALAEVDAELARAVRPGVEHDIAHTKLAWWKAEVERLVGSAPAHPATRALAGATPGADWTLLRERLAAAELALGGFRASTPAEAEALAYRSHGSLWQVAVTLLAGHANAALAGYGAALGKGIGLVIAARAPAPGLEPGVLLERARAHLALSRAAPAAERNGRLASAYVAHALALPGLAPRPPGGFVQVFTAWRAARRAYRTHDHAD